MASGWRMNVVSPVLVAVLLTSGCAEPDPSSESAGQGVAVVETTIADTSNGAVSPSDAEGESTDSATYEGTDDSQTQPSPGPLDAVATIAGEPAEMSTDLTFPEDDRGVLNVNAARSAARNGERVAAAGNKLVIVDYEVYYTKISNLFTNAFRLTTGGQSFEPLDNINELGTFGQILNSRLVFEVPAEADDLVLEGGLPAGTPGGLTATFELIFGADSGQPADLDGSDGGLVEDATVTSVVGDASVIATDISDTERAVLSVENAKVTGRDGDYFAHEGTKLVIVDFVLSDFESFGNIFDNAFRLQADDEWYSPLNSINETGNVGETLTSRVVFEVPRATGAFLFEAGPPAILMRLDGFPDQSTENPSASWELVFG